MTSTFPRWTGDTEPRFVLDLCRRLAESMDVLVLAPHAPGAALEEVLEGVRVQRFRYFIPRWQALTYRGGITARLRENAWRILQVPLLLAALGWTLRRQARTWAPDVIHAHWIIPQGAVASWVVRNRVPLLCTSHGGDLQSLRGRLFQRLKSWTLRRCQAVTVVSDSMVPQVRALAPECPVTVVPMGTDLTGRFTPPDNTVERESSLLVFVGRLVEKKGVRHLLSAFALLKDSRPELRLGIAGDGPLANDLKGQAVALGIAERVTFFGGISHSELAAIYRRATLAIFPFVVAADGDQEGFGLVVVEAMGCGCPVIASDLPAVRQSIQPDITGVLVPPGNADALARAIVESLDNEAEREKRAQTALATVRERFDWRPIAARYGRLIDDLSRKPAGAG